MSQESKFLEESEPSYGQITSLPTIGLDGEGGLPVVAPIDKEVEEPYTTKDEASMLQVSHQ